MSILSSLFRGKITWGVAVAQIDNWATQTEAQIPGMTALAGTVVTDLKQAASDAIAAADTLAGPLLATGADAVSAAFTTAATAYLGPVGAVASPAVHDAVNKLRDGLKDAIDAEAAALIASLKPAPAVTTSNALQQASQSLSAQPNG